MLVPGGLYVEKNSVICVFHPRHYPVAVSGPEPWTSAWIVSVLSTVHSHTRSCYADANF